jgi:MFS family permease
MQSASSCWWRGSSPTAATSSTATPATYQIAGLAAAIVAGAQILGGIAAPWIGRRFHRRTSALIAMAGSSASLTGSRSRRSRCRVVTGSPA